MLHSLAALALLTLTAAAPHASAPFLHNAFPLLTFSRPVDLQSPPDGSNRLFVAQQTGEIYVVDYDVGATGASLFLGLADSVEFGGESGLLGLAFHPGYAANRRFYVSYVAAAPMRQLLVEYTTSATNPDSVDASSRRVILETPATTLYHHAGQIAFGLDGKLLYSIGEDTQPEAAQDRTNLLGTLVRIDVDNPSGGMEYGIPLDNPYAGNTEGYREEILAFGFRNPWRFSVDPATGRIWCGDVGSSYFEEINVVWPGRNYGWPRVEYDQCVSPPVCDTTGLDIAMPVHAYPHGASAAVVGGHVNHGSRLPDFDGWYLYTDFTQGEIRAIQWDGMSAAVDSLVIVTGRVFTCSGIAPDGHILFATLGGDIYEVRQDTGTAAQTPAPRAVLVGNHPNPFNPATTITYGLSAPGRVRIDIFDVRGRPLTGFDRTHATPGRHGVYWNGRDARGRVMPSGAYFVRLKVGGRVAGGHTMILLK